VEKIFVGGDEDGALRLGVGEQGVVGVPGGKIASA
jgi:hypothetical protein